jgi:2-keto-4-pentenoate hydratase/2-oxohepta-3-ene-1,7-dioic acid hydratase in catechol pathway
VAEVGKRQGLSIVKLVSYSTSNGPRVGAERDADTLVDLALGVQARDASIAPAFLNMQNLIDAGSGAVEAARAIVADPPERAIVRRNGVSLLAPLPRPVKLRDFSCFELHIKQAAQGAARAMAANAPDPEAAYKSILESGAFANLPSPGWYALPGYYYSDATTVVGHDAEVQWPPYSQWIDYELEFAAVIGTSGKDISRDAASGHIFGYTIFNDLSARDAQLAAMQTSLGPAKGKDFDGSNVLGPCIVTADEIPDPYNLAMVGRVNGEEISRGTTADMHWRFEDCIEYASRSQTVHAGEVFGSGTVGNGSTIELGVTLARGDVIELEIEKIGVLRTPVR